MRPIRSLLFAPGNRPELVGKFPRYPADAFAIDLEDAVPEAEKDEARRALPAIVASLREQKLSAQLFIRTNASRSRHAEADLAAALEMSVDGVMMPKLESVNELKKFAAQIDRSGHGVQLIGVIETARGVLNV